MSLSFQTFSQKDITDQLLQDAATLFTDHYGIWGSRSKLCGRRVKLTAKRLRDQCLPENGDCSYTTAISDGQLVGHAFTCRWDWDGKRVCWVTQLVVHKEHRGKGIASTLLRLSRAESDNVYGIMSSHPYAFLATAASFGLSIVNTSLDFIRDHAEGIMKASPIDYVATAVVAGSLFCKEDSTGLISGVDTNFLVDHEELLHALNHVKSFRHWPLGDLPDGHEFLLILPAQARQSTSPVSGG
ncbi:hypothetical protein LCI18_013517 [Fusarium solani-melongenae]|uniref:Uncharacterized protein n=1 Tax=Fusarium solani subsp. cucurbitae TaxID=2747967 RepID=A0ACD3ZNQ5_FUSSC|nr:hypothetical protein LCI18_013517 [Fusarium solani-melongenae]